MIKTNIAKAVAFAITGSALSIAGLSSAVASGTDYNTYNAYASNIVSDKGVGETDGWAEAWASESNPFGTTATVANWAAHISAAGDNLTVSSQDAHNRYEIWADIDTAKGAWQDASSTPTGWGHNTDVGLFKSDVATDVTLKLTSIQPSGSNETWTNFGVSIFTGMSNGAWNHHGTWNCPSCTGDDHTPFDSNNPLGSNNLTYLTHDATVDAINGITFHANAGQVYSILLGGNAGNDNFSPHAGYSVSLTTVPVPGAVWLFGSAIAGLVGFKRHRG